MSLAEFSSYLLSRKVKRDIERISTMHSRIAYLLLGLLILLLSACTSPSSLNPTGTINRTPTAQPTRSTGQQRSAPPPATATPTATPGVTSSIPYLHLPQGLQISSYSMNFHTPTFIT